MYRFSSYLLLIVSLLLVRCSSPLDVEKNIIKTPVGSDSANYKFDVIKPLQVGNNWSYRVKNLDSNGTLISTSGLINTIDRDTNIDNVHWYNNDIQGVDWQANQSDGLHFRRYNGGSPVVDWLEAKYPGNAGYTWQSDSVQRKIMAVDTVIVVTAGTFTCYFYYDVSLLPPNGWIHKKVFYAPKIGLVKEEILKEINGGKKYICQSIELISYKVAFGL